MKIIAKFNEAVTNRPIIINPDHVLTVKEGAPGRVNILLSDGSIVALEGELDDVAARLKV